MVSKVCVCCPFKIKESFILSLNLIWDLISHIKLCQYSKKLLEFISVVKAFAQFFEFTKYIYEYTHAQREYSDTEKQTSSNK